MSKKTIEHAASVLKEIKAEIKDDVIKDHKILTLINMESEKEMGFALNLILSTKYTYSSSLFENWRKRLVAHNYFIRVNQNKLTISFNVIKKKRS